MANIKTYARIKPGPKLYPEYKTSNDTVTINTTNGRTDWPASSSRNIPSDVYKFSHVFPHDSSQEQIFDTAAKDTVEAFLNGYNGTIFAYGQTGSGKTYTMEGTARLYRDRGLAPRAISMIYNALANQKDADNSIHMSYLEIYQEVGYDLLNPAARNSSAVTPFPKVVVLDCMGGSCLVKNLSSHLAASEAVAQSLLLQGQANRKVAETPMNQRSSRSHAVLTVQLTSRKTGSDIITRSKLHLVDLAGSERVAKTRTEGVQLMEAKYINLSLHHLEGVIIALQHEAGGKSGGKSLGPWTKNKHYKSYSPYNMQWNRQSTSSFSMTRRPFDGSDIYQTSKHIPYRNSLLTMVLKDSLGGNCMTSMIATLNLEYSNLGETLSTCRFAQRVACITNTVRKNEEIDDKSLIRQLQRRIGQLEAELTLIKLGQVSANSDDATLTSSKLTDEDKIFCEDLMKDFVAGKVKNPLTQGVSTPQLFCQCLRHLRDLIVNHECQTNPRITSSATNTKTERPVCHPSASTGDLKSVVTKEEKREKIVMTKRPASSGSGPRAQTSTDRFSTKGESGERPPSGNSSRGKYKSPYEKKREKEIKKLNDKIEKALNHQLDEEKKMQDWKSHIKREQLEILMKEIRTVCLSTCLHPESGDMRVQILNKHLGRIAMVLLISLILHGDSFYFSHKANQTREQLASQHAYILKLKHEGAESDLIKQERIAEKQLKKREAKIERRLDHVKLKIDQAGSSDDKDCPTSSQMRPKSVEEKYSQLIKSDGSLNTRRVLEKLHIEERNHHVKESNLQRQRINTVAEELELREAATRQKLHEFKEKLRMFRETRSSPGMFSSTDKTFNSSGYESFQMSGFSGLNTTDADKSELLASFAERENIVKSIPERYQNGESLNENVVSAFKPYKGSAKIVPKSGWLDGKSEIIQNDKVDKTGCVDAKSELRNGPLENGAEGFELDGSGEMKFNRNQNGQSALDYAFKHESSFKMFSEMNKGKSQKVTSSAEKENYPFIKATLCECESGERSEFASGSFDVEKKSSPIFTKPPLPSRQESVTNGWTMGQAKQHASASDKWNNGYSPVSSRPSTGDRWRSSSLPPKSSEKHTAITEKWNSGTTSRPSSGNSTEFLSCNGDPGEKWNSSHRSSSPIDSWSGVRPGDILRMKSASPKDFAQSYDTEGLLGNVPLLVKSHSNDVNTFDDAASKLLKDFAKMDTKSASAKKSDKNSNCSHKHPERKLKQRSRSDRNEKNRKNLRAFGDFRDPSPASDSKPLSFPEPARDQADDTYLPSEVNTRGDLDLRKMTLKDKGFDSALSCMLSDGHGASRRKPSPGAKETKTKAKMFDALLNSDAIDGDPPSQRIQAYKEEEREPKYMERVKHEKERVARIRRVRSAAETIQGFWRRYQARK
ncbi:kinesin heavy chain-like [Lineus longissimus]|uniref:kinesin heavy chain-like n=1 Tax=Lineus longissimus TaxID=88925 RepID=UPI00315CDEF8